MLVYFLSERVFFVVFSDIKMGIRSKTMYITGKNRLKYNSKDAVSSALKCYKIVKRKCNFCNEKSHKTCRYS